MKRVNFKPADRDDQDDNTPVTRPAAEQFNPLKCDAPGCQWTGTAGHNGRFSCIAHLGAEMKDLQAITKRTLELQWFAVFITDIQRMHTYPRKNEAGWIAYADEFWVNSNRTMQPTMPERRSPVLYVNRMLAELRAMALGKERPKPHLPQSQWPEFSGRLPLGETAEAAP